MGRRRDLKGEVAQWEDPVWEPLLGLLGDELAGRFIYTADGRCGRRLVTVAGKGVGHGAKRYPCGDATRERDGRAPMNDYLVSYEQDDAGGWGARCPDVEGIFALGLTREEAESRMTKALSAHLAPLREHGRPVPEPRTAAGTVAA